jgi:Transposase DDE domain
MTLVLTPGPRHEALVCAQLMEAGAVKRRGPGRPRRRPHRVVGANGYRSRHIRQYARQHGIRMTLPRTQNDCPQGPVHRAIYRLRKRIERLVKRCQQFRRLATRDEKRAQNSPAMWLIGATVL